MFNNKQEKFMDFSKFNRAIQRQFELMQKHPLLYVHVDKDELVAKYLASFPEGSNPIFKKRTEHDCSCCKSFIRNIGAAVAIIDNQLVSLWDLRVDDPNYQAVAHSMAEFIKSKPIENVYLNTEKQVGVAKNFSKAKDSEQVSVFHHFFVELPKHLVVSGAQVGPRRSDVSATVQVFSRSLSELTSEACETVLELISQNSLYRGEEHKFAVSEFYKLKTQYSKLPRDRSRELFVWSKSTNKDIPGSVLRIRNTAIGTLLVNLSEGMDIDRAVTAYEQVVAPTNYKRPTAIVTKAMVENAKKTIQELGLENALERRFANLNDVSVNDIIFVDRSIRKQLKDDVFSDISGKLGDKTKKFDKVEEMSIDKFISDVVPHATSVEVMFENRHKSNLMSLIAPVNLTSKPLFKWSNPFSWSYNGDLTDSIKERVKAAGGRVDADFRCSLSWFNYDDLDLHLKLPSNTVIYYGNKNTPDFLGELDVDMNAGCGSTRSPVENIYFADRKRMPEGVYTMVVHNFSKRETVDVGFDAEIEFDGTVMPFSYKKALAAKEQVVVAKFTFSRKDGFKIIESLPSEGRVETVWNIPTQTFHKVNLLTFSPNYWGDKPVGNKHYFFFLDKCANDGTGRGFYNEFLSPELDKHRKVLEIVGSKMRAELVEDQLSGLGFSSTKRDSITVRVTGSFTRTVKVLF
jgi:hypothetical protein